MLNHIVHILCASVCVPVHTSVHMYMYLCLPICTSVQQSLPVCASMYQCVPASTSVYQRLPVCTSVYQCVPVCISVYQCVSHGCILLLSYSTLSQYMADDVIGAIVHVRQAKKGKTSGSGTKYNETEAQHPFDNYYPASYSPSLVCVCVCLCVCVSQLIWRLIE